MKPLTGQKLKVLEALESGDWVSGTYFLHTLKISQFHTRIYELQENGWDIEASKFKNEFGFKSYRLKK
jgi:biotin operon repressor